MLLLTYFNPIIGPDILYSLPENLESRISEDDLGQIKRLMDTAAPGVFTHAFSRELNTANFFFYGALQVGARETRDGHDHEDYGGRRSKLEIL